MVNAKNGKVATESFVLAVAAQTENRLGERIDELDSKLDKRFDKVMEHLVDIAGKVIEHTDQIKNLQRAVFVTP